MGDVVRVTEDVTLEGEGYKLSFSGEMWVVGNRFMPMWLDCRLDGFDEPDSWARVEVRNGAPRVVEFGFRAKEGQREIRQKDLREVQVSSIIEHFYAGVVFAPDESGVVRSNLLSDGELNRAVGDFLYEARLEKGKRRINTQLLKAVAQVYRDNVDHAPTQAVARVFGASQRQASNYVQEARRRNILPPTSQGKTRA